MHYARAAKGLNFSHTLADRLFISASVGTLEGELVMTLRQLSLICTVTAASVMTSIFVSCGGGAMSGGADAKKDKKSSGAESASDEDATDPQVIAGAYLTCDYTSPAKSEVGCAVQNEGKNIAPTKSERIDYFAQTNGPKNSPKNPSTNTNYPAVFTASDNVKSSTMATTKFSAILTGPNGLKEWSCDGANLPCRAALTNLSGYWNGVDMTTDGFINQAKADVFCDGRGLKNSKDIAKAYNDWAISAVSILSNVFNPKNNASVETNAVQDIPACKKSTKPGPGCKVVPVRLMLTKNGKLVPSGVLTVLIYKDGSDMTELDKITGNCN